jgi:hypothetical protein
MGRIVEWLRVKEFGRMLKEVALACFEGLSRFLLDETEENQKSYSDFSMYEPRFENRTSTFESGAVITRPRQLLMETGLMHCRHLEDWKSELCPWI